ncbi:ABC transporter permease [Clostridiaceae bacterium]|nr:ABC transporter permease [Clostridiaceae bacterium]
MIRPKRKGWNQRLFLLCWSGLFVAVLIGITVAGVVWGEEALATDFSRKNMPPCWAYPFGTDWMGRDMFIRTITGLSLSIRLGLFTAAVSAGIGTIMGVAAVTGKWADGVTGCIIDMVMGIPHMLLLILISVAVGKGFWGVAVGISLTHWTSLARLLRAEALQMKESSYVAIARKLGKGWIYIAGKHMIPHLLPQLLAGMVLLFPHAILHEAGITFLGFGLSPEQPAIGVILSESIGHLMMGRWWLALFPGALLATVVMMFHVIGNTLASVLDPKQAQV